MSIGKFLPSIDFAIAAIFLIGIKYFFMATFSLFDKQSFTLIEGELYYFIKCIVLMILSKNKNRQLWTNYSIGHTNLLGSKSVQIISNPLVSV